MTRWLATALLTVLATAVLATVMLVPTAWAQSPPPGQDPPSPQPSQELPSVEGAANPLDAPLVGAGSAVDTILQSETLWYAVDAQPGQRVGATVLVVGRPTGPASEDTSLEVTLTDPQRQPITEAEAEFTGQEEAVAELPAEEIPPVGGDRPLLSVGLRSRTGQADLQSEAYRLQFAIVIDGSPLPVDPPTPEGTESAPGSPAPAPTVTAVPPPAPRPAQPVRDLVPIALVALAIGGFAGFELSRRGL